MTSPVMIQLHSVPTAALGVLADHDDPVDPTAVLAALSEQEYGIVRVRNALALLRDLGLASERFDDCSRPLYAATADGRAAVGSALTSGTKLDSEAGR